MMFAVAEVARSTKNVAGPTELGLKLRRRALVF
jgi:hypothetical protein